MLYILCQDVSQKEASNSSQTIQINVNYFEDVLLMGCQNLTLISNRPCTVRISHSSIVKKSSSIILLAINNLQHLLAKILYVLSSQLFWNLQLLSSLTLISNSCREVTNISKKPRTYAEGRVCNMYYFNVECNSYE